MKFKVEQPMSLAHVEPSWANLFRLPPAVIPIAPFFPTWRNALGLVACFFRRGHHWEEIRRSDKSRWLTCPRCAYSLLIVGEEEFVARVESISFRQYRVTYERREGAPNSCGW